MCLPVEAGDAEEVSDGGTFANIHLVSVTCIFVPLLYSESDNRGRKQFMRPIEKVTVS